MPQIMLIPFDGQEIGQGYNSATRESLGTALSVDNIGEGPVDGQTSATSFVMVTTQESLLESLGVSASADVRIGLFSGDAKMSFAESHSVNSFSSFVAGRSFITNAMKHGHGFKLTPEAEKLVVAGRMDEFKTAFGDMFVRSLKTGGEFIVVARITSVSEEHQTKLAAALHGEYTSLTTGVSFSTAFETAMKETQSKTEVTVFMTQTGGQGGQVSFTGPDATKILDRLSNLPQSVHDHPGGYETELASYNTIPIPVPTPVEKEARETVLADCLSQKTHFLKVIADLDLALGVDGPKLFDKLPPADDLARIQGQYRQALNALMRHAIRVSKGEMDPPQEFVANPAPPAVSLTKQPFLSLSAALIGEWVTMSADVSNNPSRLLIQAGSDLLHSNMTGFFQDLASGAGQVTAVGEIDAKAQTLTVRFVRVGHLARQFEDIMECSLRGSELEVIDTHTTTVFLPPNTPPNTIKRVLTFRRT